MELTPEQCEIVTAASKHHRVAARSGHKTGKSAADIALALWFYYTFDMARVIMTATTNAQIRNVLWRELKIRTMRARIPFPVVPDLPNIGMRSEDGTKEIIGLSTKEAERIAGLSGSNMLFIVDEASGVPEYIFEAIEGNRAGGAWIVMTSNPTQPAGTFYDAFHEQSSSWHTIHLSSIKAAAHRPHIPGLATDEWVQEKLKDWGPDDPRYQVRVLGDFADSSEYSVIPLAHVQRAFDDWGDTATDDTCRIEIGVDVARFGDDKSVICIRRGKKVLEFIVRGKLNRRELAALVIEKAERYHRAGEKKPLVKVDACGVGVGVVAILANSDKVDVYGVDSSELSSMPDEYVNVRSQLWFALADWLKEGGTVPRVPKLEGDLLAPKYDFDARNRRRVEKKEETKKRLNRSPDIADALALSVFTPIARLVYNIPKRAKGGIYRFGRTARGY